GRTLTSFRLLAKFGGRGAGGVSHPGESPPNALRARSAKPSEPITFTSPRQILLATAAGDGSAQVPSRDSGLATTDASWPAASAAGTWGFQAMTPSGRMSAAPVHPDPAPSAGAA